MEMIGQDTAVNVVSSTGGLVVSVQSVKSGEITWKRERKSEGYLGQSTDRYDAVFMGIEGNIEFNSGPSASLMDLITAINTATRSRLPTAETFTIVTTLRFPDGQARRVVVPNVQFGDIPITIGSRTDKVTFKLDFGADEATILAAA